MAQGALFWNDDKSRACRPGLSIHPFVRIDAWSIVPPRITISTEIGRDAFDSTNPNVLVSTSPPTAVLDMLRVETAAPGEPTWIRISPAAPVTIRAVISACTARRQAGHFGRFNGEDFQNGVVCPVATAALGRTAVSELAVL